MPAERAMIYPVEPNAIGLKHPFDCKLAKGGSEWPLDTFTCRRIADGSVTRTPPKVTEPAAAPAEPVAHAAG